ncbi:MAG TPA: cysteine desulfurase family protein [Candidatus Saccharibacteria bacterium]|nr:cysteine desulfurase family protein [Candidatus Saccharibacteria bacterium]
MSSKVHYLDHAAATPLDERVIAAMRPYLTDVFYNPSASYGGGRQARQALEEARQMIALILGVKAYDIVFTAGATESVHLALEGVLKGGGHAVVGATEHAAVRAAVEPYEHSVARADKRGVVTAAAVREALRDDTVVVSVGLADSEFGVIQPMREIAAVVDEERRRRHEAGSVVPLYFHSDGSQAAIALDLKVSRLGLDMLSLNSAKCYGPKQTGILWLKPSVRLAPLMGGGGQERGLRSGTENVASAIGFAHALQLVQKRRHNETKRLGELRKALVEPLLAALPDLVVDGHPKRQLPGHVHLHLDGLDAERVVFHLDNKGICIATGAACAANKATRSPALEAVGLSPTEADGSLRLSLGHLNQLEDMPYVASQIIEAIKTERSL